MKKFIPVLILLAFLIPHASAYNYSTAGMDLISDLPQYKVVDYNDLTNYEIYFKAEITDQTNLVPYALDWLVKRQDTNYKCNNDIVFGALDGKLITNTNGIYTISQNPRTYLITFGEQDLDGDFADSTKWVTDDDRSDVPYLCYNARNTALAENVNDGADGLTLHMAQSRIMTLLIFDGDPPQVFKDLESGNSGGDNGGGVGSFVSNLPFNAFYFFAGMMALVLSRRVRK